MWGKISLMIIVFVSLISTIFAEEIEDSKQNEEGKKLCSLGWNAEHYDKDIAKAKKYYKLASEKKYKYANHLLVSIFKYEKNYPEVIKYLEKIIETTPRKKSKQIFSHEIALSYLNMNQLPRAIETYKKFIPADGYNHIGDLFVEPKDYNKAIKWYQKAVEAGNYVRISELVSLLKYNKKKQEYNKLIKKLTVKKKFQVFFNLGNTFAKKNPSLALDFYRRSKRSKAFINNYCGEVYLRKNKIEKAKKYFKKAVKLKSKYYEPLRSLAKIYDDNKQTKLANLYWQKAFNAVNLNKRYPNSSLDFIYTVFKAKKTAEYEKIYLKYIETERNMPESNNVFNGDEESYYEPLYYLYYLQKDQQKMAEILKISKELNFTDDFLEVFYIDFGEYDKVLKILLSQKIQDYSEIARTYRKIKNYDKAIEYSELYLEKIKKTSLCDIDSQGYTFKDIAELYYEKKDYKKALEFALKAARYYDYKPILLRKIYKKINEKQ